MGIVQSRASFSFSELLTVNSPPQRTAQPNLVPEGQRDERQTGQPLRRDLDAPERQGQVQITAFRIVGAEQLPATPGRIVDGPDELKARRGGRQLGLIFTSGRDRADLPGAE